MLYKKKNQPLTAELFRCPTAEYRAAPFWAWNCRLNRALLDREIDCMKDMGFLMTKTSGRPALRAVT